MSRKLVAVPLVGDSIPPALVEELEANIRPLVDDYVLLEAARSASRTRQEQQEKARELEGDWFLCISPWERLEQDAGVAMRQAIAAPVVHNRFQFEVCPLASPETFSPGRLEARLVPVEAMLERHPRPSGRLRRLFSRTPGDLGVRMYDLRPLLGGSGGIWRPLQLAPERAFYPPVKTDGYS